MNLSEIPIACPYCGESICILIEDQQHDQEYIEDCQVCCRPITINVSPGFDGEMQVDARSENDTY